MGKIEIPLDIKGVRVIEAEINEKGEVVIKVENIEEGTKCRKCRREIKNFHGYDREIRLRHLPVFNKKVYIEIKPKRYRCPYCEGNPTTTQKSEWYEANAGYTKAYEQMILVQVINSTIVDCSKKQHISEEEVEGIIDRNIETSIDWEIYESIPVIGIDEIAIKKGHKDYVVIISTVGEQGVEIIAVLEDRKKETVKAFFNKIPLRIKQSIERVCTDLYEGYINAAKEELPQAQIVADRFHITKAYRNCADKERKKELKRLKKELPESEYEELVVLQKSWYSKNQEENSRILMNKPITKSWKKTVLEKQMVFLTKRLIRVRKSRFFLSICWVLSLPTVCFSMGKLR